MLSQAGPLRGGARLTAKALRGNVRDAESLRRVRRQRVVHGTRFVECRWIEIRTFENLPSSITARAIVSTTLYYTHALFYR